LLESKEEERATLIEWATKCESILSAGKRRIFDWRKSIPRLETLVTQKSEHVSVKLVRA
jgi:hypothetical protein